MTDIQTLTNLFDSPSGPSRPPPRYSPPPRTPSPPSSPTRAGAGHHSSEPLFLSPGDTPSRARPRDEERYPRRASPGLEIPPQRKAQQQQTRRDGANASEPYGAAAPYAPGYDPMAVVFDPMAGLNTPDDEEPAKKKRKPLPKIDAERLMSEKGLPTLIKAAKKFKVRGKGHEKSDLTALLNVYQLWAHQMFPKGDFMGTIGRVENVLRTRRMESAMKGYRDAFYPPPRSPTPPPGSPREDDRSISPINPALTPPGKSADSRRGSEPLFQEVEDDPELEDMMAMEEMEREAAAVKSKEMSRTATDEGPVQLDEEDEWEGLYD